MKRTIFLVFCCALLAVSMRANAQTSQTSGQMLLSKNVSGPITDSSVELTLTTNAECDQTQTLLPDGTKLLSQSFSVNTDINGVGTFQGAAQLVSPDGRTVLQGQLRGTVGINPRCSGATGCRLPGHLEGLFETIPSNYERLATRSTTDQKVGMMMLNFSADLNPLSTNRMPTHQGRLDGLVPTLPAAAARVSIAPDKASYLVNDVVTAILTNSSDQTIQATGRQSYCTTVQLQIQDGEQWNEIATCPLSTGSFPPHVSPGQQINIPLAPTTGMGAAVAGIYRLTFTFRFVLNGSAVGDPYAVSSQPFQISLLPPTSDVVVKAERDVYQDREAVSVKINNNSDQPIVTMDHKSYCSIIDVQNQQVNKWVVVAPCLLSTPTRLVKIRAREEIPILISNDNPASKLAPGTYRLELLYWAMNANGQPTGDPVTVYSKTFTVIAKE